jgi:hypothetical protein
MPYLFFPVLILCCGYAIARGGPPERLCAAVLVIGTALTILAAPPPDQRFRHLELGIFMVDVISLFGFMGIALFAERYWPMWMTSMQLVAVMSHATSLLTSTPLPWAYAVAIAFWSYPMLVLLAWGTARHRSRVRQFDSDRAWVSPGRLAQ